MMKTQPPMRNVVSNSFLNTPRSKPGAGKRQFVLDCGHTIVRKASVPQPKRAHCPTCASAEAPAAAVPQQPLSA